MWVIFMAYFLKKTNNKKGTYLQIYESYYDPERKGGAHRSYKPIGYIHELVSKGIDDPIAYFQMEVDELNRQHNEKKVANKSKTISDESPEKNLGYFLLKNINDSLRVKQYIDIMQTSTDFRFNVYNIMSSLVYSRVVHPCSKSKTYDEVIPKLFEPTDFSVDQLYTGLAYLGMEYEKVIEIYNYQINLKYKFNTSYTYFDCTNFYFEIDREDNFRKKGPSKENRHEPIIGLGLLLDANQIPIGMKLFPGNESEKPILRHVINSLKTRNNISGRTIQVADKGLNCGNNIIHALKEGDGYIFSKSVKILSKTEKEWILLQNDYREVKDNNGNVLYKIKECIDDFEYIISNENKSKRKVKLTEKRVITFNPVLAKKQLYEINKLVEKAKNLKTSHAKKSEYGECSKYVNFVSTDKKGNETNSKIKVTINEEAIENARKLAGYNMLVTSELKMSAQEIYKAYHNLWRIEESFRIMKSELDARPVYLQKEETITGHFLICYLAVLLTRLLQFKVLESEFCSEEIFAFIRDFRVAQISDRKYMNLARNSSFIKALLLKTKLPLTSYFLSIGQVKKMLNHRF